MTISTKHAHPWIFVGPFLLGLAACPQDKPITTNDPEDVDTTADPSTSTTTSDAPTSTTTVALTSSGEPSTTTGEPSTTTGETSEQGSTSSTSDTSSTSTTTLDPDTTTGGNVCQFDLSVSLALGFDKCDGQLVLIATVHNVGSVDAPAGVDVSFYEGTNNTGSKLATLPTSEPLTPGSSTNVAFAVNAPPMGEPRDYFVEIADECEVDNNSNVITNAECRG